MKAFEELVNILSNFTQEQLNQFLNNPVTASILQPEEEAESCLQEVS